MTKTDPLKIGLENVYYRSMFTFNAEGTIHYRGVSAIVYCNEKSKTYKASIWYNIMTGDEYITASDLTTLKEEFKKIVDKNYEKIKDLI